jgi:hypothetical protein
MREATLAGGILDREIFIRLTMVIFRWPFLLCRALHHIRSGILGVFSDDLALLLRQ